jgi:hypothetical protein
MSGGGNMRPGTSRRWQASARTSLRKMSYGKLAALCPPPRAKGEAGSSPPSGNEKSKRRLLLEVPQIQFCGFFSRGARANGGVRPNFSGRRRYAWRPERVRVGTKPGPDGAGRGARGVAGRRGRRLRRAERSRARILDSPHLPQARAGPSRWRTCKPAETEEDLAPWNQARRPPWWRRRSFAAAALGVPAEAIDRGAR